MTIAPFSSDDELVNFAKKFLREHIMRFRKDINICLTQDAKGSHAYFPALITCIAFADLVSGLYAGNLKSHGLRELKAYAAKFMDSNSYDSDRLDILYEFIRHKVAHLGQPYVVFDTITKQQAFSPMARKRIAWTVNASRHTPSIRLISYRTPRVLVKTLTPWKVSYDHRVTISVRSLAVDIVSSIHNPNGYLDHLSNDQRARSRFAKCMVEFYPR